MHVILRRILTYACNSPENTNVYLLFSVEYKHMHVILRRIDTYKCNSIFQKQVFEIGSNYTLSNLLSGYTSIIWSECTFRFI